MTLLLNASQVLTLAGGPQRGSDLGNLKIIEDGAVFFQNEQIIEVGTSSDLLRNYPNEPRLGCGWQSSHAWICRPAYPPRLGG